MHFFSILYAFLFIFIFLFEKAMAAGAMNLVATTSHASLMRTIESQENLPLKILEAIALVESGMSSKNPTSWPWVLNVAGKGYSFKTKEEAIKAVHSFRAKGYQSIDVGIMQINLKHHPHAFRNLEQALDPHTNIAYAAQFLKTLFSKYRSWHQAIKHYHSANPMLGNIYLQKVLKAWTRVRKHDLHIQTIGGSLTQDIDWQTLPPAGKIMEGKFETSGKKIVPITVSFFPLKLGNRHSSSEHPPSPGAISPQDGVYPIHVSAQGRKKGKNTLRPLKAVERAPRVSQKIHVLPLSYSKAEVLPLH